VDEHGETPKALNFDRIARDNRLHGNIISKEVSMRQGVRDFRLKWLRMLSKEKLLCKRVFINQVRD
jgi:hypothetical protein